MPPKVADKVTERAVTTGVVDTVKLAEFAPAAIVTVAGVVATALSELDRVTVAPEAPANPLRFTVPVTEVEDPPTTDVGDTRRFERPDGCRVKMHDFSVEP